MPIRVSLTGSRWTPADPEAEGCLITELHCIPNVKGVIAGMFWRFLVANDHTVDRYIIRDADSRVSQRERDAVNDWINSGLKFHTMKDHPKHHGWPILGGTWGGVKDAIPPLLLSDLLFNHRLDYLMMKHAGDQVSCFQSSRFFMTMSSHYVFY